VEICQRIETAENEMRRIIYGFGFAARSTSPWQKSCSPSRPRNVSIASSWTKRSPVVIRHLKVLRALVKKARTLDQKVDEKYAAWQKVVVKARRQKLANEFRRLDRNLQGMFPKFYYTKTRH